MKKNYLASDELDLFKFFELIWNKKISFLVILLISILSGIILSNSNTKEDQYEISLKIFPAKDNEFIKFSSITNYLGDIFNPQNINPLSTFSSQDESNTINKQIIPSKILENFVLEFKDYDEVEKVLLDYLDVNKKIIQSSKNDKQIQISRYVKLISLDKIPNLESDVYILKFKWHNPDEAFQILVEILSLILKNLDRSTFATLELFLELKKNSLIDKDLERISYLREQSSIAKELEIENNQVETINETLDRSFLLNINTNTNNENAAYYLRGYKAINKEIELIKNRKYPEITKLETKLNSLKKDETKWVTYNPIVSETQKISNNDDSKKYLIICVIIGLIIGVFYAHISSAFQLRKTTKKK